MSPKSAPRSLTLLGSTGSIGTQALEVVAAHPGRFDVYGLAAAGTNPALLAAQARATKAQVVAVFQEAAAPAVRAELTGTATRVLAGPQAAAELAAAGTDVVLNAITGSIGLAPTLAALAAGSTLALANKESLVVGGPLVKAALQRPDQLVPVDSEHSAIAQCLRAGTQAEVARLILTASGGPFRGYSRDQLAAVTLAQALAHPTWNMGPVVTINSATLMNKALELIEAHLLFDIAAERIQVVVHPQSVIHSMVEFTDGSTIAQASPPDMKLPIALGLAWPHRLENVAAPVDWTRAHTWSFEPLDAQVFGAIELARAALAASPTHPAVFNAANEEAVQAFQAGTCRFDAIVEVVGAVLSAWQGAGPTLTLEHIAAAETWARQAAREKVTTCQ